MHADRNVRMLIAYSTLPDCVGHDSGHTPEDQKDQMNATNRQTYTDGRRERERI